MKIKSNVAVSDNGFLFNPITGESYSLNTIGREILLLLKDGKEYEEIKDSVLDHYHTDETTFEKDFQDFINTLTHFQLIDTTDEDN